MTINIVDAERILDKELSDAQVELLKSAREGVPFADADGRTLDALIDRGLVEVIPFSHPRAIKSINGVVPSEDGTKVLNLIDSRHWQDPTVNLQDPPEGPQDREFVEKSQEVPKGVEAYDSDIEYVVAEDDQPHGAEVTPDKDGKPKLDTNKKSK